MKSEVFFIQSKKCVNSVIKIESDEKVTKMGSITGHKIDYNEVGALRGQRHIPSKN